MGVILIFFGQIGTFIQLQVSYKYGWYEKYSWALVLASVPLGWLYLKSVHYFISGFGGEIWPSRLVGFGIGVMVFTAMSVIIFHEPLNLKNGICLGLGFVIVLIQILVK